MRQQVSTRSKGIFYPSSDTLPSLEPIRGHTHWQMSRLKSCDSLEPRCSGRYDKLLLIAVFLPVFWLRFSLLSELVSNGVKCWSEQGFPLWHVFITHNIIPRSTFWRNRRGVKTLRRDKVDEMEPTVFLERLRLTASYRLLNILSVAGGQLSSWESSEAEGINKLREGTSVL